MRNVLFCKFIGETENFFEIAVRYLWESSHDFSFVAQTEIIIDIFTLEKTKK